MNKRKFDAQVSRYRQNGQRWGQAVMNTYYGMGEAWAVSDVLTVETESGTRLPDIWEHDFLSAEVVVWYNHIEAIRTDTH